MRTDCGLNATFSPVAALRGKLAQWLDGEPLHGSLWRAGLPRTMREEVAA